MVVMMVRVGMTVVMRRTCDYEGGGDEGGGGSKDDCYSCDFNTTGNSWKLMAMARGTGVKVHTFLSQVCTSYTFTYPQLSHPRGILPILTIY